MKIAMLMSRIELLKSRNRDNGKIVAKLERRIRKLQESNNTK